MSATATNGEHLLVTAAIHLAERARRLRFIKCRVFHRKAEIRISFSALLSFREGGRYALVRNLHRPEVFGPLGGVFKYRLSAKGKLDKLSFRQDEIGAGVDMRDDLRGFLPRMFLPRLLKWYEAGEERETPIECIRRELREELREINIKLRVPSTPELKTRPPNFRRTKRGPWPGL